MLSMDARVNVNQCLYRCVTWKVLPVLADSAWCTSNQRLAPALVRAPGGTVLQKRMHKHHEVSLHAISPKLSCFEVSLQAVFQVQFQASRFHSMWKNDSLVYEVQIRETRVR